MKSEDENWNLYATIGSLFIIALLINAFFFTRASHNRQAKEQQAREMAAKALQDQETRQAREKEEQEKAGAAQREQAAKEGSERQERERAAAALEQAAKEAREQEMREKAAVAQREQAVREVEARAEAARQESAAAHVRYLARYLDAGFQRQPQTPTIAVAVANEERTSDREIAAALAQRFQTNNLRLLSSFFTPEVVLDGLLTNMISGRGDVIANLELTNSLDALLLGQQKVEYSTNASLENTVTANLRLELMALPVRATAERQSWTFSAIGVGFQPHEARALAEERILKQIARDTNMVLAPSLPRNR